MRLEARGHGYRLSVAVFLLLAGVYLLTTGGHTYASDEEQMFAVSEALALRGSFAIGAAADGAPRYSNYGPGQPVLALPLYTLGRMVAGLFPPEGYAYITRALVGWLNPLVTAATGALLALAAMRLGYGARAAVAAALVYGLATFAWPHSKTFFAEPLAAALTFASFVLALGGRAYRPAPTQGGRAHGSAPAGTGRTERAAPTGGGGTYGSAPAGTGRTERPAPTGGGGTYGSAPHGVGLAYGSARMGRLVVSGVFAGLACAVKLQAGLALPFLGLWVLWNEGRGQPDTRMRSSGAGGERATMWARASGVAGLRRALAGGLAWGLGAATALGALGAFQWVLFGSPLRSGYGGVGGVGALMSTPLAEGLYGLVLSPGKGLIWYAPPLVLLPWGLALLWRRDRGAAALCAALTAATLAFYAGLLFWHGDGAWGPRYLNMALPFMALPLTALLAAGKAPRVALALTLALAVPVQLGGVLVNLNAYLGVQRDDQRRYYEPAQSPIVGHLRLVGQQLGATYALHLAPGTLVLADGFSYSEGDRAAGAQLPRWTLPEARIVVRPPLGASGGVRVDLALSGCRPAPASPASLTVTAGGVEMSIPGACPPRRLALLLPPSGGELRLASPGWRPASLGIDREGELGVYLTGASAWSGGRPLALAGRLVPIPPAPAGHVALRQWTSDYRYGHWDFWPWYLAHTGLPAGPAWALGLAWFTLAVGLIVAGVVGLRRKW